jgi:MFS family permease
MSGAASLSAVFLLLPSQLIVKRIGVQKTVFILAAFQIVCGVIRIATPLFVPTVHTTVYFWLIFVSQMFVSLPLAFVTSLPPQISANWFGAKERSIATSIGALAQLVGLAGGQTSGFAVHDACEFHWLFIGQGIFCCCTGILGFFFRERPPSPPSLSRTESSVQLMSLKAEIVAAFRVRAFIILWIVYGFGVGTFVALWGVLQNVTETVTLAVDVSLLLCGSGIVGAVIGGVLLDRFRMAKTYKILMVIAVTVGSVGLAIFAYSVISKNSHLTLGSAALVGFFMVGMTPVCFEVGQELIFPVSATTSTALLLMFGNLVGLIYVLLFSLLRHDTHLILIIIFSLFGAMSLLLIFFHPVCKRMELEEKKREESNDGIN